MKTVTVATFNERSDAEALKQNLRESGIQADVHDLKGLQRLFFARDHLAGITVEVMPKDFERTRELFQQWEKTDGPLKEAVHCPQCGSTRIEYPQYGRKFFTTGLHLSLGIALGIIQKEFYCEDCQYTWPKEEKLDVKRDVMGWPVKR